MLTCVIMLDLLIEAYVQFATMLTELRKVLSQSLKCLLQSQDYQSPIGMELRV
jgi:hypothetical protein